MLRLLLVCVASSLCLGCGKTSPPPAASAPEANAEAPAATPEAGLQNTLAELTQALRKFSVERQQVPTSLNELVATGYLQKLPPPPPGKMFRIDTKNVRVVAK